MQGDISTVSAPSRRAVYNKKLLDCNMIIAHEVCSARGTLMQ